MNVGNVLRDRPSVKLNKQWNNSSRIAALLSDESMGYTDPDAVAPLPPAASSESPPPTSASPSVPSSSADAANVADDKQQQRQQAGGSASPPPSSSDAPAASSSPSGQAVATAMAASSPPNSAESPSGATSPESEKAALSSEDLLQKHMQKKKLKKETKDYWMRQKPPFAY